MSALRFELDAADGGRVASLTVDGHELLVARDPSDPSPFRHGSFLMAPYAGRERGATFEFAGQRYDLPPSAPPHAAHGLVADVGWSAGAGGLHAVFDERWPFGGEVDVHAIARDVSLELVAVVRNEQRTMPANLGWHTWFRRHVDGHEATLATSADEIFEPDGVITSRRRGPRDASRTWTAPAGPSFRIRWDGLLDLQFTSPDAGCWVIHETDDAICVEPQLAPGNALHTGDAPLVGPQRPITLSLLIAVNRTAAGSPRDRARPASTAAPRHPVRPSGRS